MPSFLRFRSHPAFTLIRDTRSHPSDQATMETSIGSNSSRVGQVGILVRTYIPITCPSWEEVKKNHLWDLHDCILMTICAQGVFVADGRRRNFYPHCASLPYYHAFILVE
ncbi:hypothetical protein F0562_030741 [Nyssa sinensis]|uniref:Uncharacterized protein n=1 Tax=Nyssa sinensis TaxID=561372 RepID=A0A5J5B1U2_9ASTE|nr:hypothetical protein F0562_030741 [Nyssa sinensis]